jgi:hypothetical protein
VISRFDGNFLFVMYILSGHIVPYSDVHENRTLST